MDVPAEDIFSNLEFGVMGIVAARKGNWGFGCDAIWMSLGASSSDLPVDVDFDQGGLAFYGIRRLGPAADLTFGARYNLLRGAVKGSGPLATDVEQDKSWVDPVVGLILRTPGDHAVGFQCYAEVGGLGIGSDIAWQLFPAVTVRLSKSSSLDFGYRWLYMDYSDGEGQDEFGYDMMTQGPVMGLIFRF
jgi:hypothetical protein